MAVLSNCRNLPALACVLALAACGGGGEPESVGMPPIMSADLALSDSNYQLAGRASVSTALALSGPAVASPPGLLREAVGLTRRALRAPGTPLALLFGIELRQTLPCSEGGNAVVTLADTNGNRRFDNGDSLVLEAQSCKEDGTVMQGRISFAVQTLTGVYDSSSYGVTLAVTLTGFSATRGSDTVRGDGTLNLSLSQTPAGVSEVVLSTNYMGFSGSIAGQPFTSTLSGVKLTLRTEPLSGGGRVSISYEGKLAGGELDHSEVTVKTLEPLVILGSDRYPGSGQLLVQGRAGSAVRISAVNATQARLELDSQGDGHYETQAVRNWAALN